MSANGENMPRAQRQRSQDACSATYYRSIRRGVQRSRASFARPLASCLLVVATHAHERREKQPEEIARPVGRQTSRAAARRPRGQPRSIHHVRYGRCGLSDHSECPITALPSTNLPNRVRVSRDPQMFFRCNSQDTRGSSAPARPRSFVKRTFLNFEIRCLALIAEMTVG